jgi:hypothetical protein
MWAAIRWLVLRLAAVRWLFKLSGLALLLPLAFLLKTIGLPLLAVLSVVGLPILFLLLIFGLPIFMVVLVGGLLMGALGAVLTIGVAAVKIGLFVVLPIWLMWMLATKLYRWFFGGPGGKNDSGESAAPAPPPPPAPDDFDPA